MLFPSLVPYHEGLAVVGGLMSVPSFLTVQRLAPEKITYTIKDEVAYKTRNSLMRIASFGIGCIGMGISATPLFYAVHQINPTIIFTTLGIASAFFGGASMITFMFPSGFLKGYGGALFGGITGLIGINIVSLIAKNYFGLTMLADVLQTAESFIGIGLFTMMIMYDTARAIRRYKQKDADHVGMAVQLLLDVWNLIIRIATEIAKSQNKKK
jgi:FtsH-binding integral membrane protein